MKLNSLELLANLQSVAVASVLNGWYWLL